MSTATVEQLFDNRGPAPSRRRDLDPDLVEHLRDAAEDLCRHPKYRIVFWIGEPGPPVGVAEAFRAQFEYHIERLRLRRRRREQGRTIRVALLLALALGSALLALSHLVAQSITGWLGVSAREALVIVSWVVL